MHERRHDKRMAAELVCPQDLNRRRSLPVVPGRSTRFVAALAVFALLAAVLVLFLQVQGFLGHLETRLSVETGGDTRLRAMGQHMETLRDKFNGLLAESVEVRLKALEKSVETGQVSSDDLRIFEELQYDLRLLENYAGSGGALNLDYAQREHRRFSAMPESRPVVRNDDLMNEVLKLKTLIYVCMAALATGAVAIMGYYWIVLRQNARCIETTAGRVPLLFHSDNNG